jgi:3-deoxy-D-manno-octulosonate 8-phosphate phosphatase (KDO 8-P phosphatase)
MENFKEKLTRVEAFVFDVDGVFTDGVISPIPGGDIMRSYNAKDGYAVTYAISEGYKIFIVTGARGELLHERFVKGMKVTALYPNIADKAAAMRDIVEKYGINLANTLYMGDDIPDLGALKMVGVPVCPADAGVEAREASIYVSQYGGGRGCVRDVIEQVVRAQGKWMRHTVALHTVQDSGQKEQK